MASSSQRPQLATLDGNDLITELYGEGMKSASAAKIFTDHHGVPDILLSFYAHVLDASADMAAATMSGQLGGGFSSPVAAHGVD